jgi:hypothetical protein
MADPVALDFYFDPACGWAWRTSLWMRLVAKERPLKITWKLFSLGFVNAPDDLRSDPAQLSGRMRGADLVRTLILAGRRDGNEAVDRLYVSYGNALHGRKEDTRAPGAQARLLAEAGLAPTLYDEAQADPSTETELISATQAAIERLGAFGVPTLALEGSSIGVFGPVVHPVPVGQEALDLWDYVHFSLKQPYLYEMKRSRVRLDVPQFASADGLPAAAPVAVG